MLIRPRLPDCGYKDRPLFTLSHESQKKIQQTAECFR